MNNEENQPQVAEESEEKVFNYLVQLRVKSTPVRTRPKSAVIIFQTKTNEIWKWELDLKSFEPVHGMSRVAKLVPDKLATALAINQENLPKPDDDGSFMIDLVKNLAEFYKDMVSARSEQVEEESESAREEGVDGVIEIQSGSLTCLPGSGSENAKSFFQVFVTFLGLLEEMNKSLKARQLDPAIETAKEIVRVAEDILACAIIYLDFLHPIWIDVKRRGEENPGEVELLELRMKQKLQRSNGEVLGKEFRELFLLNNF